MNGLWPSFQILACGRKHFQNLEIYKATSVFIQAIGHSGVDSARRPLKDLDIYWITNAFTQAIGHSGVDSVKRDLEDLDIYKATSVFTQVTFIDVGIHLP